MSVELETSKLKEKAIEFESALPSYEKEMAKINKTYQESVKSAPAAIKVKIKSLQNQINKSKVRLSELQKGGLSKNKDGSISQRSNAGKEAVRLQGKIPQLQVDLEDLQIKAGDILEELKIEVEEKRATLTSDFNSKTAKLQSDITDLLKRYFDSHVQDKGHFSQGIVKLLRPNPVVSDIENYVTKLQEQHQEQVQILPSESVIEGYLKILKFKDFNIKVPHHDTFFNVIFCGEYTKVAWHRHLLRWGLLYVIIISAIIGINMGGNPSDANQQALGIIVILSTCCWPFAFIGSFFYKRAKRKIHKGAAKELRPMKSSIDETTDHALLALMHARIERDIGVDLTEFIDKIRGEK